MNPKSEIQFRGSIPYACFKKAPLSQSEIEQTVLCSLPAIYLLAMSSKQRSKMRTGHSLDSRDQRKFQDLAYRCWSEFEPMNTVKRLWQRVWDPIPQLHIIRRTRPIKKKKQRSILDLFLSHQIKDFQRRRIDSAGRIVRRSKPDRMTLLKRLAEHHGNLKRKAEKVKATKRIVSELEHEIAVEHAKAEGTPSPVPRADEAHRRRILDHLSRRLSEAQEELEEAHR